MCVSVHSFQNCLSETKNEFKKIYKFLHKSLWTIICLTDTASELCSDNGSAHDTPIRPILPGTTTTCISLNSSNVSYLFLILHFIISCLSPGTNACVFVYLQWIFRRFATSYRGVNISGVFSFNSSGEFVSELSPRVTKDREMLISIKGSLR